MEIRYLHKVKGDKSGFVRTDILQRHLFPEQICGHVPENVVWSPIANKFKTRFVNKPVLVYHQDAGDQVTKTADLSRHAVGHCYWKRTVMDIEAAYFAYAPLHFLLEAARWTRFRIHAVGQPIRVSLWPRTLRGKFLILVTAPLGIAWVVYDWARSRR